MYRLSSGSLALALVCFCCAVTESMTQMEHILTDNKPRRCSHERAYDMYGAYCAGLKLHDIPSLKSSIEILDFSENRLQEIKADTFAYYTNIKYLYLAENQIYNIDKNAFASLTSLQILDLSNNVIIDFPETIFQIPSLRKLYLRDNPVLHLSLKLMQLQKPIKAPLEMLDISNCKIEELPNWGTLPYLVSYNISHNPLKSLEAQHFAPMCKLQKVDLSKSTDKIALCDIKPAITWLQDKGVNFQFDSDEYSKLNTREFEECPAIAPQYDVLNSTHYRCKALYLEIQKVSRRTWLTVTGGLAGFLVGFMLLLYLMHRRNVAQTKVDKKKTTPMNDPDKTATLPILVNEANNVSRL